MPEGEVVYHIRGDNSKLPDDLKNAEKIIGDSADKVEKAALGAIKAIGAAASAAAAAGTAIGTAAVKSADDLDKAVKRVTSATGEGAAAAEKYSEVIKGVYGDNFGENFDDIAATISKITQNLGEMDAEPLEKITESAYALQDAFDMDVAETSRAAKAMVENFGIAVEDAFDYIAKGAQDGLDYSGELLDNISEYSVQFKKLGLSADDMFTIFANGAENGAWNLDKIGDAVKEFSIRAIDGSDTTKKGFEALGYDAEDMAKKFAQGGDVARDAFQTIIKALGEMEDPIAQNEAGVNLFGTMWEDLGADAVKALGDISDSAYDCAGAVDEIVEVNYSSLSDALGGLKRQVELLIQPLGDELIPVVSEVIYKLGKIADEVVPVLLDAAEPLVESLLKMIDPISQLISELLPPLIEMVGDIAKRLSDFVAKHIPELTTVLKNAVEFISKALKVAWEARDAIAAIAIALVTFKTAIKIGNAVQAAVTAIRSFKTITDAATVSQLALNAAGAANPFVLIGSLAAGAVGGIAALSGAMDDCNERMADLTSKSDELTQSSQEYQEQTKGLEDVKKRYEKVYNSTKDTAEKETELKALQEELNKQFGDLAGSIDLVADSYQGVIDKMNGVISKSYEMSESQARMGLTAAEEAEKESTAIGLFAMNTNGTNDYLLSEALKLGTFKSSDSNIFGGNMYFSGSYEDRIKDLEYLRDLAADKYNETRIDDYRQYASRLDEQINNLKSGLDAKNNAETALANVQSMKDEAEKSKRLAGSVGYGVYGNTKAFNDYYFKGNTEEPPAEPEHESTYTYKPYTPTADTSKTKTSSGGSSSSTGSQGNFVSITSYVPTMWDNDQTAALKSLIGKDVLGKTASAHQINALTGAISGAAESSSASKETDLADVINAITKLQRKVEKFENAFGDMTIELTAGDLTIGKACVRDCNIMAKRSGKSPFNF